MKLKFSFLDVCAIGVLLGALIPFIFVANHIEQENQTRMQTVRVQLVKHHGETPNQSIDLGEGWYYVPSDTNVNRVLADFIIARSGDPHVVLDVFSSMSRVHAESRKASAITVVAAELGITNGYFIRVSRL